MSGDAVAPAEAGTATAALDERVAASQLRLIHDQWHRVPWSVLASNAFLVWLMSTVGLLWPALVWALVDALLQLSRWRLVMPDAAGVKRTAIQDVQRLTLLFGVLGVWRACLVPLLFSLPASPIHYVFTMVTVGVAAGGVGTVGGLHRGYRLWCGLVLLAVAAGWLVQRSVEGVAVAALLVLLWTVLSGCVRDYGRTLRQLDLLAETAQAASQSKTRFFAAASHDLRQPLHALAINATTLQLVARKYNEPLITELSQSINRALRQGNGLLDGLLDISRLDANAVRVTLEPIEARGLLAQVCEEFKGVAAQRGIQLRVGHTLADDFWMATDAELMLRMVNNLVNNAIKFTSVGAVTLSARRMPAATAGEPDDIVLRVEDSGCGIPSAERQRVFEEFYQIGNPSRDQSRGLGLGLSIVQRSAALLKVRVTLDSREGEGTTVELRVPGSVPPPPMPVPRGGPDDPAGVEQLLRKGLRVLVVDDEDMILQSLAGLLPLLGCEARFAHDLPRAMRALDAGFVPDVLLIDQRLNGESGTDVIVALRERLGPVPALVVTGETAPIPLQNALSSGCRVIHKPVDGPRLARALAEITANLTA